MLITRTGNTLDVHMKYILNFIRKLYLLGFWCPEAFKNSYYKTNSAGREVNVYLGAPT